MKPKTLLLLAGLMTLLAAYTAPAHAGWTNDPWNGMVSVCNAPGWQQYIKTCQLARNNTFTAWADERLGSSQWRTYYQLLDYAGRPLLQLNGKPIFEGNWYNGLQEIISDRQGGCITVVTDNRNGSLDLWAQRTDSLGNRLWGDNGLPLAVWPGSETIYANDLASDILGNFFVGWQVGWPQADVYVQKFNVAGQRLWGEYGMPVCIYSGAQYWIHLVPDNLGGVEAMWRDERAGMENPRLYFQHLDASGNPRLALNGVPVLDQQGGQIGTDGANGVSDGGGGGIWISSMGGGPSLVHMLRVNAQGQTLWCWITWTPYFRTLADLLRHADGTYWSSISEYRPVAPGLYLYHFDVNGNQLFGLQGRNTGGILTSSSNGVISGKSQTIGQMGGNCAIRVDSSGLASPATYYALSHMGNYFLSATCSPNGADGVVYSFEDQRDSLDWQNISAQQVNADGTLGTPNKTHPLPEKTIASQSGAGSPLFIIQEAGPVMLELFDVLGRKVFARDEGYQPPGPYNMPMEKWDLPSGVYLVKLTSAGKEQIKKIVIMR